MELRLANRDIKRFATIITDSPKYGEETNNHIRNCQVNKQKVHSCSHTFIFKHDETDK